MPAAEVAIGLSSGGTTDTVTDVSVSAVLLSGVRFLSELALVVAMAVTGVGVADGWVAAAAAVALPAAAVAVWGRWVAPKASHLLPDPARAVVEAVLFACAVAGLALTGHVRWAIALVAAGAVGAVGARVRPLPPV